METNEGQRIETENRTLVDEDPISRKRRLNNEANRRYRQTEKGKKTNAIKCKKYFQSHRTQCQQYVVNYKKTFLEKYGVGFTAWNYWRKKLADGTCSEADVPPKYGMVLNEWKRKQGVANALDDGIASSAGNM